MSVDDIIMGIEKDLANDGNADYIMMIEGMGVLGVIFTTISSLLLTLIIIGIPIIVAIEVMYLNLPLVRDRYEDMLVNSGGRVNDVLSFTVKDAKKALVHANTMETGKSANLQYLIIKIKSILIAALVISLILQARPTVIIYLWNLITGIIKNIRL